MMNDVVYVVVCKLGLIVVENFNLIIFSEDGIMFIFGKEVKIN